jgi:phage terminase large subunit-like protein
MVFQPDANDDLNNPSTWEKVNPNWGVSLKPKEVHSQYNQNKLSISLLQQWQNFCLNHWTKTKSGWLSNIAIEGVLVNDTLQDYYGGKVVISFDLSITTDLTAFSFLVEVEGKKPCLFTKGYIPEKSLNERLRLENPLYLDWVEQGIVATIPGQVIDDDFLYNDVINIISQYNLEVVSIAHDLYRAKNLVQLFTNDGFDVIAIPQNFSGIGVGLNELENAILKQSINIENNPLLLWCLSNTELLTDKNGNRKPVKPVVGRDRVRIDATISSIMAYYRYLVLKNNFVVAPKLEEFSDDLFVGW